MAIAFWVGVGVDVVVGGVVDAVVVAVDVAVDIGKSFLVAVKCSCCGWCCWFHVIRAHR